MSRLLVIGTGPLLEESTARLVSGQCLRTLHFVRPLIEQNHKVGLITVPIPGTEVNQNKFSKEKCSLVDDEKKEVRYTALGTSSEEHIVPYLINKMKNKNYDAVVGVNPYPAYLLAMTKPRVPFWADLNGYTMAEGQTRSRLLGHDRDQFHFWRMEATTLMKADRFSTVTQRQSHALLGELAMLGRFLSTTFREDFSVSVPNAVYKLYANLDRIEQNNLQQRGEVLERLQLHIDPDASIVLWSGGFNTWTDVELLVEALKNVLEHNPETHFVATGGAVSGHDDVTFEKFQKLAKKNLPAERVHLLGWTETQNVLDLHRISTVGINVDSPNMETQFGARNRLTNMIGAGLPVVTTTGTEIADWMQDNDVGLTTALGNSEEFAAAILETLQNQEHHLAKANDSRSLALRVFAPEYTLKKFLEWCNSPVKSGDHSPTDFESDITAYMRQISSGQIQQWAEDSASLRILREKLPMRVWLNLKKIIKGKS